MPIRYTIDDGRRLVVARGEGVFTEQEVFDYQNEVWSRPEVAGYDELIDMTAVTEIRMPSPTRGRLKQLAWLSARMDHAGATSKSAIVAPGNLAFGLGRMYEAYRNMERDGNKRVEVFRSEEGALKFLGIAEIPEEKQNDGPG